MNLNEDEFKERLKEFLLEFDVQSVDYPDPAYAGVMLWEYYLKTHGVKDAEYSQDMVTYKFRMYAEKEKQEKEELQKRFKR